jgi:Family of unknown function (DUF5999)
MCPHLPACPPADRPDHAAARTVAAHPEQGWGLLCNGVIVFDHLGEIVPGRLVTPPLMKQIHRTKRPRGSAGRRQEPLAIDPRDADIVCPHRTARRSSRPDAGRVRPVSHDPAAPVPGR